MTRREIQVVKKLRHKRLFPFRDICLCGYVGDHLTGILHSVTRGVYVAEAWVMALPLAYLCSVLPNLRQPGAHLVATMASSFME